MATLDDESMELGDPADDTGHYVVEYKPDL